ncbi:MAG: hypothetical protein EBR94_09550, partial [Bacteroidetes bacterium]|nr:hypothetical protein [Bacteroidota bacterium]
MAQKASTPAAIGGEIPQTPMEKIIASMSLEEKVGQMTQIDLGVIAKGATCALTQPQTIDADKL